MEHKAIITQPVGDNLGSSIEKLFILLSKLKPIESGDSVIIDMTRIRFAHPILILPLASLITKLRYLGAEVTVVGQNDYLFTILFPEGFDALNYPGWEDILNRYRHRTFLPICKIPSGNGDTGIRENLMTVFEEIMRYQLNITGQLRTAISYIISETMDNIVEHAGISNGWIMVQNYPKKQFLDICILDNGIGIRRSYADNGFNDVTSDEAAIQRAINGQSTKPLAETRGYGINTSRRMLVDGIKGKYLLFSGAAIYIYTNEMEQITRLERNYSWNGTMLALRIPCDAPSGFNYIDYVEFA